MKESEVLDFILALVIQVFIVLNCSVFHPPYFADPVTEFIPEQQQQQKEILSLTRDFREYQ